jgi:hypothetical protein
MKKLLFTSFLLCFFSTVVAQVDTIYNKKHQKIPCKIIEINEFEIKYKIVGLDNGPMVIINKSSVIKYRLSNGFVEVLSPDELSLENEHAEILKNRTVIKIHPFSLVNQKVAVAFEKVIKVGMNLDVEVGYVNSNISRNTSFGGSPAFKTGAYIKPGIKFFLGQDYSVRGLKYAHPLKGRYVKLDLAISYLNFHDVYRYGYSQNYSAYYYTKSDLNVLAYFR